MRPQKSKTARTSQSRTTRGARGAVGPHPPAPLSRRERGKSHPSPSGRGAGGEGRQQTALPQTPKKKPPRPPQLDNAQKKLLRALGHELKPVIQIGKEGLTETLLASTDAVLKARELIKVRLGQGAPLERAEAAEALCRTCGAALVQEIGHVLLLYRPNPNLPAEKRIKL